MTNLITGAITEKKLDAWIATNRPDIASYDDRGNKGFYKVNQGPAASFQVCGPTWRHVAAELGAVVVAA